MNFTRPRLRALMPLLAAEGGDTHNLARLASRLARANAAVEILVGGAERYLAPRGSEAPRSGFGAKTFGAKAFHANAKVFSPMPEETPLRLFLRAIDRFGH